MLAPEGNTTPPSAHPARLSLPAALQLGDHGSWRSGNIYTSIGQSSFYMLCVWGFKKKQWVYDWKESWVLLSPPFQSRDVDLRLSLFHVPHDEYIWGGFPAPY